MVVSLIYRLGKYTMQELLAYELFGQVSKPQAVITIQVYLELVELKKYYSVEYNFYANINKMIITGKRKKDAPMCAFIPVTVSEYLDFSLLQTFIKAHTCPLTYIVVVAADSTTVYYQIEDGLVEPDDNPAKNQKLDRRQQIDRELEKHRDIIEDAALLGIKAILPPKSDASSEPQMDSNSQGECSHSINVLPGCSGVFMNP